MFIDTVQSSFTYNKKGNRLLGLYGKLKSNLTFHQVTSYYEGLATVLLADKFNQLKWGYINQEGELLINNTFTHQPQSFQNGLAAVKSKEGLWGYIDKAGEVVITPKFKKVFPFSENRALVELTYSDKKILYGDNYRNYSSWCYISNKGDVLENLKDYKISRLGIAPKVGGGFFTLSKGKDRCIFSSDYLQTGIIENISDKRIYLKGDFNSNRCLVTIQSKYGFINEKGDVLIKQGTSEF